jgi:hypothetical protein
MALTAPTVTGYSPFWQNLLSPQNGASPYSMSQDKARAKGAYLIAKLMRKGGMRDARGALAALIGAAAGGTATNQYKRVQGQITPTAVGDLGGSRDIETVDAINRATTAADITELKKWFAQNLLEAGITYSTAVGNSLSNGMMQAGGTGRF